MSLWIQLVLGVLATWRVTHLLASEDGPADLIVRFRAVLGHGVAGRMMDCFNCLSLWVAAPIALLITQNPAELLLAWLGLSGAACLLERVGHAPAIIQPVMQDIEGGESDGMLRPAEGLARQPAGTGADAVAGRRI